MALLQGLVCYTAAIALGLEPSISIVYALLLLLPVSLLYIALGLLCGSLLNDKQVGGICGALLTNLSAWLSGIWFDLELVGGAFQDVAYALPFVHAVELERAALAGDLSAIFPHLWWVLGYAVGLLILSIAAFLRQMRKQ
jgi:ABC-2 type transport system permease protein